MVRACRSKRQQFAVCDRSKLEDAGKEVVVEMGPDGIPRRSTYMGGGLPDAEGVRQTATRFPRP